jgi:hypothetical protein
VKVFFASLVAVVAMSVAAWAVLDSVRESTAEANLSHYNTTRL